MSLAPLGLRYPDGEPLAGPIDEAELAANLVADAASVTRRTLPGPLTFEELEPMAAADRSNPATAGWSIVIGERAHDREQLVERLQPLASLRGMADPTTPIVYTGGSEVETVNWIDDAYLGLGSDRPRYLLLAGGPDTLPFELQTELAAAGATVGRVAFDSHDDLTTYVEKVVRLEDALEDPVTQPTAIVFATDAGIHDPTYYSRRYLAEPIAGMIEADGRFTVERLFGSAATKEALLDAVRQTTPALVFTASHGIFAEPSAGLDVQRRVNGAICCQHRAGAPLDDWLLRANDLPIDRPVWPGAIVVQFACWSYGTPTESTFSHWRGARSQVTAQEGFVGAIPKRLLAHPNGPIGFIGHVDTAWLAGFDDPAHPIPAGAYNPRAEAFRTLVERTLFDLNAAGFGLEDLNLRTATLSLSIANLFDALQRRGQTVADLGPAELTRLVDLFVRRNDSMHFLFYGDPGARVRVNS